MPELTDTDRAALLWEGLNCCMALSGEVAVSTVTHWLEYHGAGYPDVSLMGQRARDDASMWAASSHQTELEAYLAASLIALEKSPLTDRAAKRMGAMAFKNMNAESRANFKKWINTQ